MPVNNKQGDPFTERLTQCNIGLDLDRVSKRKGFRGMFKCKHYLIKTLGTIFVAMVPSGKDRSTKSWTNLQISAIIAFSNFF